MGAERQRKRMMRNASLKWQAVWRDESGAFTLLSLFIIAIMLTCFGFAIDLMRAEATRARLQGTLDQSILAAASRFGNIDPNTGLARTPEEIARSYFKAAGLDPALPNIVSNGDCNDSFVQADANIDVKTTYLAVDYVVPGAESFPATETMPRIEVSLVLDVSGSMGRNSRIDNLRPAAKEFVDMMLETTCEKPNVYISIIPFATQVSVGPDLLSRFDASEEHDYSQCVDFTGGSFGSLAIAPGATLARTGHFDPWLGSGTNPTDLGGDWHDTYWVCHPDASRDILPWSIDQTALDSFIDNMPVGGNTSMDVGAAWGLALLDPALRPVVNEYVAEGKVDSYYSGRPLAYSGNPSDVIKVLVLMTDGENTDQYYLKDSYRDGASGIWADDDGHYSSYMGLFYSNDSDWTPGAPWTDRSRVPPSSLVKWTSGNSRGIKKSQAFHVFFQHDRTNTRGDRNAWYPIPYGANPATFSFDAARYNAPADLDDEDSRFDVEETGHQTRLALYGATEMSYPRLFDNVHVQYWSDKIRYEAQVTSIGRWDSWYDAVKWIEPGVKDSRLHTICQKAREEDVEIFTISFEAPAAGQAALLNCANDGASTSRYFDVEGSEIRDAFASIVEQLNLLRLTK